MDAKVNCGLRWMRRQEGKIGYAIAWLLGVPLPVLLVIFLLRGCQ